MIDNGKPVAIVTGGTRGLGKAVAERLLADGWNVAICGRRSPDQPVTAGGRDAKAFEADIRDPAASAKFVEDVATSFGRLDLLVNNAGGAPKADFAQSSTRLIEKIVALNLLAPLFMSHAAYPHLRAAQGSIVNVGSISGRRPSPGTTAYGAAKAGLLNATTSLAQEWGPEVRVNAIIVGLVDDPGQVEHYGGQEGLQRIAAQIPLRRMARGPDLASVVAWLASPEAAYVSGACVELHGGGEPAAFQSLARGEGDR
jgi:NAD(P)-dependent dehydrogenase (short-subunit alcohol dehydrogenase family)